MIGIFYDTETTGLPLFNEPSEDPRQPHIVQLAAVLVDLDTRRVGAGINLVVRPDGWEIPADIAAIHGVTTEYAMSVGVPEPLALRLFLALYNSRKRIAHNEPFDARIIRIGLKRYDVGFDADEWKAGEAECTQVLSTPILQLPPTAKMRAKGRNHFKSANLGEAYQHFTGNELVGAHDAMTDVQACMQVYFAIKYGTAHPPVEAPLVDRQYYRADGTTTVAGPGFKQRYPEEEPLAAAPERSPGGYVPGPGKQPDNLSTSGTGGSGLGIIR
jgi:DNA polymerase III subunit epsilon